MNIILKLVLYADDATLFLRDKHDLRCVLSLIGEFWLFSCLEININPTEAMWLGSKQPSAESHFDWKWEPQLRLQAYSLTILFQLGGLRQVEQTITQCKKQQQQRNLGICGKICIIKSLLCHNLCTLCKH